MARLYTITELPIGKGENPRKGHHIFRIEFHPRSIPNVGELVDWVQRQPRAGGFPRPEEFCCSITAHYESYLWLQNHTGDGGIRLKYVDLRVYSDSSAKYFLSIWKIPRKEFATNRKFLDAARWPR